MTRLPYGSHTCHPSHPHRHVLLTAPAYHTGWFICNGCDQGVSGFVYHCAECCFDLHMVCASKPLRILDQSHRHELHLAFNSPYEWGCDVCGFAGGNQWRYRCSSCNFDVHLGCAVLARAGPAQMVTPAPQQATYFHQYQYQTPTFSGKTNMQGVRPYPNGMSKGVCQYQAQPPMRPSAAGSGASWVAAAAMQGLVEGITQQAGQNLFHFATGSDGIGDGYGYGYGYGRY